MCFCQRRIDRRRMVRSYLAGIDNDSERAVCYFLMREKDDAAISKQMGITPVRLEAIKLRIAFGLKAAGIRIRKVTART